MGKNRKPTISRPCRCNNFNLQNSRKRALLRMPLIVYAPPSDPSNSLIGTRETKQIAFQTRVLVFASRELPAVAAVHALAEGRHRLVGGAGLGLCVGDLGHFASAACHAVRRRNVLVGWNRDIGFFFPLNAIKTPYRTHSHESRG